MIEIIIVIVIATLIGTIGGYMEVQVLCEQTRDETVNTTWKWKDYRKNLYWFTDQNDKSKSVYDSAHISEGVLLAIVTIMLMLILFFALRKWWVFWFTPITWQYIFWVRNIWMHIILKKVPLYKYLSPIQFKSK